MAILVLLILLVLNLLSVNPVLPVSINLMLLAASLVGGGEHADSFLRHLLMIYLSPLVIDLKDSY